MHHHRIGLKMLAKVVFLPTYLPTVFLKWTHFQVYFQPFSQQIIQFLQQIHVNICPSCIQCWNSNPRSSHNLQTRAPTLFWCLFEVFSMHEIENRISINSAIAFQPKCILVNKCSNPGADVTNKIQNTINIASHLISFNHQSASEYSSYGMLNFVYNISSCIK